VNTIHLSDADLMSDAAIQGLPGNLLYRPHYDRVITDTTTVLKPDGSVLLTYIKDALPRPLCQTVFDTFKGVHIPRSDNRGLSLAAGGQSFRRRKADGTVSNTIRWRSMPSAVLGYMDRNARNPYCRMTAFTRGHIEHFGGLLPLVGEVDRVFHQWAPERWQAQRQFVDTVAPDFVIPGTVFTSVTVNRSFRTSAHRDDGDYRPGLGVMAVLQGGRYHGCELIFPRYRTAVDMRTGGVCLADVHELHGNAPLTPDGGFVRLAFVFYAREHMHQCGTLEDELRAVRAATA
jgi:hypothetical protein